MTCKILFHKFTSCGCSAPGRTSSGWNLLLSQANCLSEDSWLIYKLCGFLFLCCWVFFKKGKLGEQRGRIWRRQREKTRLIAHRAYWWTKQLLISKPQTEEPLVQTQVNMCTEAQCIHTHIHSSKTYTQNNQYLIGNRLLGNSFLIEMMTF